MAIDALIAELNKKFDYSLISATDKDAVRRMRLEPCIDVITGGGIAINRIIEFVGPYSSGKSYMMQKLISEFQHYDWNTKTQRAIQGFDCVVKKTKSPKGEQTSVTVEKVYSTGLVKEKDIKYKRAALIDIEGTYDKSFGEFLGVNNELLIYMQPSSLTSAVDVTEALLSDPDVCLVCIDSIAAIGADAEIDNSMENEQMGVNSRFWNKAMRKFQAAMNRNPQKDITLLIINSKYDKIGFVMGDPSVNKGGNQLKLSKSQSIEFSPLKLITGKVDGNDVVMGRNVKVRCTKNKVGAPFLDSSFYISYVDDGVLKPKETNSKQQIIDIAVSKGLIERNGAWYSYDSVREMGFEFFSKKLIETGKIDELYAKII